MLLAYGVLQKKKWHKRVFWVQQIYKRRNVFGIDRLVQKIQLSNCEA